MKVEFYVSNAESKKVNALISQISLKKTFLGAYWRVAEFIGIFFIMFSMLQLIPNTLKVYNVFPVYIIFLGLFFLGMAIYFLSRWFVNKKLREKTGFHKSKVSYEIHLDKIIYLIDDGLTTEITPKDIQKFIDYKKYLFIFVRENFAYYIPSRAFLDSSKREFFKCEINKLIGCSS